MIKIKKTKKCFCQKNMLLDGFDYILEKIPYFAQSVAYGREEPKHRCDNELCSSVLPVQLSNMGWTGKRRSTETFKSILPSEGTI